MARNGKIDDLGQQERAVLDAILANPMTGQKDIAAALGLARSTVAAHIVELVRKGHILGRGYILPDSSGIVCFGGAAIDRKYYSATEIEFGTSNPVEGRRGFGGVARNVAENLGRLDVATHMVTIVGDDENGRALVRQLRDLGIDVGGVSVTSRKPTAEYAAILGPDRNLVLGIADMDIFDLIGIGDVDRVGPLLASASWVFADCNLPADVLRALISRRAGAGFQLAIGAVSTPKMDRLPADLTGIDLLFLNLDEAMARLGRGGAHRLRPEEAAKVLLAAGAKSVALTLGAAGLVVADSEGVGRVGSPPSSVIDVTGAGDALIAGTLYRLLAGDRLAEAAQTGARLAALTTECNDSVYPDLSPRLLQALASRFTASSLARPLNSREKALP